MQHSVVNIALMYLRLLFLCWKNDSGKEEKCDKKSCDCDNLYKMSIELKIDI